MPEVLRELGEKARHEAYAVGKGALGVSSSHFKNAFLEGRFMAATRAVNRDLTHIRRNAEIASKALSETNLAKDDGLKPKTEALGSIPELITNKGDAQAILRTIEVLKDQGARLASRLRETSSGYKEETMLNIVDEALQRATLTNSVPSINGIDAIIRHAKALTRRTSRSVRYLPLARHPKTAESKLREDLKEMDVDSINRHVGELLTERELLGMNRAVRLRLSLRVGNQAEEAAKIAENYYKQYMEFPKPVAIKNVKALLGIQGSLDVAMEMARASHLNDRDMRHFTADVLKNLGEFMLSAGTSRAAEIAVFFNLSSKEVEQFGPELLNEFGLIHKKRYLEGSTSEPRYTLRGKVEEDLARMEHLSSEALERLKLAKKLDRETIRELNAENIKLFSVYNIAQLHLSDDERKALEERLDEVNGRMRNMGSRMSGYTYRTVSLSELRLEVLRDVYLNSNNETEFQLMLMSKINQDIYRYFRFMNIQHVDLGELLMRITEMKRMTKDQKRNEDPPVMTDPVLFDL